VVEGRASMEGSGVFRGWVVLAGAMLVLLMGSGSFFFSYSVFLPAMADDLGWGRGALGAGLSVGLLAFGLPGPIIGASIARFGPRANNGTLAALLLLRVDWARMRLRIVHRMHHAHRRLVHLQAIIGAGARDRGGRSGRFHLPPCAGVAHRAHRMAGGLADIGRGASRRRGRNRRGPAHQGRAEVRWARPRQSTSGTD